MNQCCLRAGVDLGLIFFSSTTGLSVIDTYDDEFIQ